MAAVARSAPRVLRDNCPAFADYISFRLSPTAPGYPTTLAEQLDDLDEARLEGLSTYVATWLRRSDENRGSAYAHWRRTGDKVSWDVVVAFDMHALRGPGRLRHDALWEHAEGLTGFREKLIDLLISLGRFVDNRVQS